MLRLVVALNLTMVSVLAAQDSVIVIDPDAPVTRSVSDRVLPPEVLAEAVQFYNDSTTLRFNSSLHLPAGSVMLGALALFRGNLEVSGRSRGRSRSSMGR